VLTAVVEQTAAALAAALGRTAAARLDDAAARLGSTAGRLSSATRRFRGTTRGLATTTAKQTRMRIRGAGRNKQTGYEQGRQHNAGFHHGTPKQKTGGTRLLIRSSRGQLPLAHSCAYFRQAADDQRGNFRWESLAVGYRRPNPDGLALHRIFSSLPSRGVQVDTNRTVLQFLACTRVCRATHDFPRVEALRTAPPEHSARVAESAKTGARHSAAGLSTVRHRITGCTKRTRQGAGVWLPWIVRRDMARGHRQAR
jgi:hypothetical protein